MKNLALFAVLIRFNDSGLLFVPPCTQAHSAVTDAIIVNFN